MQSEIKYEVLAESSEKVVGELNSLLSQLSKTGRQVTEDDLTGLIGTMTELLVAKDNDRIVGSVTVAYVPQMGRVKAWIDDLVVDQSYRGQGIARNLMEMSIDQAKKHKCQNLNLTSGDDRSAAHGFYESMGFRKRETRVFRLDLK
jgi:GNAT superfamily N-acetyltransferase